MKAESENAIQAAFFRWAELQSVIYPELELLHSIPNGSNKSPASRMIFKATGLKAGVPDVFFPVARNNRHGMLIEFKSAKGRVSVEQVAWHNRLREQGFVVNVFRDWREAADAVLAYLRGEVL